jgi:hypothetical protein
MAVTTLPILDARQDAETLSDDVQTEAPIDLADLTPALAAGTSLLVGHYLVDLPTGRWWWSDEIYVMHGRRPGEIDPSVELMRSRKHPDDRGRLTRTASAALRAGRSFACSHRIVDKQGRARTVVVTGHGRRGPDGRVSQVAGYVMDISPVLREALDREASSAVARAFVTEAAIEQAKGVIMAVRGVDDVTAQHIVAEAASAVGVPAHVAGAQVMKYLAKHGAGAASAAALDAALAAVHPVDRPRGHEAQLARRRSH